MSHIGRRVAMHIAQHPEPYHAPLDEDLRAEVDAYRAQHPWDEIRAKHDAELDRMLAEKSEPVPPSRLRRFCSSIVNAFRVHPPPDRRIPEPKDLGCAECRRKDILIRVLMHHR